MRPSSQCWVVSRAAAAGLALVAIGSPTLASGSTSFDLLFPSGYGPPEKCGEPGWLEQAAENDSCGTRRRHITGCDWQNPASRVSQRRSRG